MLVFMRVRRQQHALILAHIVFRIEEIIGNSLENQLVKRGVSAYHMPLIIMLSCHPHRNIYCESSVVSKTTLLSVRFWYMVWRLSAIHDCAIIGLLDFVPLPSSSHV